MHFLIVVAVGFICFTVALDIPKAPLVEPPPIPTLTEKDADHTMAHDQPIDAIPASIAASAPAAAVLKAHPETPIESNLGGGVKIDIPPELVKTCTPDCTAAHCTIECKCLNTHNAVEFKCNPPILTEYTSHCKLWYAECPMFKPLDFNNAGAKA